MAGIALAVGVVLLRSLTLAHRSSKSPNWIPFVAFIAGPIIAVGWVALDVLFNAPSYRIAWLDLREVLLPVLAVGTFAGIVASCAFAVAVRKRARNDG